MAKELVTSELAYLRSLSPGLPPPMGPSRSYVIDALVLADIFGAKVVPVHRPRLLPERLNARELCAQVALRS